MGQKKYKRMNDNSMVGGVLSGLAYYLGWPTWILRVGFSLFVLTTGVGALPYVLVWLFANEYEKDPEDYSKICD